MRDILREEIQCVRCGHTNTRETMVNLMDHLENLQISQILEYLNSDSDINFHFCRRCYQKVQDLIEFFNNSIRRNGSSITLELTCSNNFFLSLPSPHLRYFLFCIIMTILF